MTKDCFGTYPSKRTECWTCEELTKCSLESPKSAALSPISDGSTASYYELPPDAKELQDLISFLNCNAQLGEIGRAWYRYGRCPHSERQRDLKKIIFYAKAELARLEKYK